MFWKNALPLMEEQKITQTNISTATGKPFSTVHSWITRECPPQADDALKIADLLGVSVRYLVTGEDDKELSAREKELLRVCSILKDDKFKAVLDVARIMRKDAEQELSGGLSYGDSKVK